MQEYYSPGTQAHSSFFSGAIELISCKDGPWNEMVNGIGTLRQSF